MFRVMVVDDNADDLNGVLEFIPWENIGCEVVATADNGRSGLEKAFAEKPNIILTDISMPFMDGIEMTQKIREKLPDTRIIFMSCFDDFEYAQNAISFGVSSYVLKPIVVEELITALLKAMGEEEEAMEKALVEFNLRNQIRESLPLLRENFFMNLLFGIIKGSKAIKEQANYLNIDCEKQFYLVIAKVDEEKQEENEKTYLDLQLLKEHASQTVIKALNGFCVGYNTSSLVCIIPERKDYGELLLQFTQMQQQFFWDCEKTVTVCVGKQCRPMEELSAEFKHIASIFREEYFTMDGKIVVAEDIMREKDEMQSYSFNEIYEDVTDLFTSRMNDIDGFINKYYGSIEDMHETYIKSLTISIINIMNMLLIDRNISIEQIFGDNVSIWKKITQTQNILNLCQWIKNILLMTKEYLFTQEDDTHQQIVDRIKHIINEDYAVIQTLDEVVSQLYISVGYASRLFKKYTNETIFDYLLHTKMEKAKEMLHQKELKAYEVGEKLGYTSTAYFTTSFKKYTGLTPKEYRQKYQGGQAE